MEDLEKEKEKKIRKDLSTTKIMYAYDKTINFCFDNLITIIKGITYLHHYFDFILMLEIYKLIELHRN